MSTYYWVMGAGEPMHKRGYNSIVDARKLAARKLKENKSYAVTQNGTLTIVKASEEPYGHMKNYRVVAMISCSKTPGIYDYKEYNQTSFRYGPVKKVSDKGSILRG